MRNLDKESPYLISLLFIMACKSQVCLPLKTEPKSFLTCYAKKLLDSATFRTYENEQRVLYVFIVCFICRKVCVVDNEFK